MALRSNFPQQLLDDALPLLDALIYEEFDRLPDNISQIFNMKEIDTWGLQDLIMGGTRAAVQKNEGENVTFDDPIEGSDRTYTPVEFSLAVSFSQNLVEDDRLHLVDDTYRGLGASMFQTRQVTAFNILNNGFTDTGPDGSSLFNATHSMAGGHTYGNRPATDVVLSVAGLREMEVDLMRQVSHRNLNVSMMPEVLAVPPELSHAAKELVKSQDRPDTDARATNVHYNLYKIIVSPFLTATAAWFAFSNPRQHKMKFVDRIGPETETWQDKASGDINTKIRARFTAGYSDFPGTWGTSP